VSDRPPGLQFAPADQTRHSAGMQAALEQSNAINVRIGEDGSVSVDDPAYDEVEEDPEGSQPPYLRGEFGANLAEDLLENELQNLAADIQAGIDSDISDRKDWDDTASMFIDYLGLKIIKDAGSNVGGGVLTKVWDPLMMEVSITFWANAVAEFLPSAGPCKVRDDSPPAVAPAPPPPLGSPPPMGHNGGPPLVEADAPGNRAVSRTELAQAFELDMNHYLTVGDRSYYQDFSRMLFNLGPLGTQFRKIYYCPLRGRPVSEWVRATDLIVSSDATSLSTAARVTQIIKMPQSKLKRLQLSGWWRKVDVSMPVEEQSNMEKEIGAAEGVTRQPFASEDHMHTIEEVYVERDLAGFWHTDENGEKTGIPLPYRISIEKTSGKILEIRRNWREDDEHFGARPRFVFFGMIPGVGFYAMGFMHVVGNGELALTAIGRMLLDAGQFANFPGFLMSKGLGRQQNTRMQVNPGEGTEIDTGEKAIGDVVMKLPYNEPSQVLAELASAYVQRFQKLAGAADVPVGEGTADIPVGTMIAMLEQGTKIMSAVHKGLHASRAEELELLRELIAEDPSVLTKKNKRPARRWEQAEEFLDLDLVPSSDPNVPSQLHRIMQATALAQLATQLPGVFNPRWVAEDVLRTIGKETPAEAFAAPQGAPPPSLADQAKMAMAQASMQRNQLMAQDTQRKAAEAVTSSENDRQTAALNAQTQQAQLASKEKIAGMQEQTERVRLAAETAKSAHEASLAERQHQQNAASGIVIPGGHGQ
jgi:hypothetical protein